MRSGEPTDLSRQLMGGIVVSSKSVPPVPAHTIATVSLQHVRERALCRVYQPDGHVMPRNLKGEPQVSVVGEHDRGIHVLCKDISDEVSCDIDVRTLLLEGGVVDKEIHIAFRPASFFRVQPLRNQARPG